jgi:hypothetical protein
MSAARYTNKIRTDSEARVRKVQYRYNDAVSNPLASTCNANPDYTILNYVQNISCDCITRAQAPPPPPVTMIYNGGDAFVNFGTPLLFGGNAESNFVVILNGGNSTL